MAGLGMLPVNGALKTRVGDQRQREPDPEGYRSAIDKATEETSLGYYAVKLTDYGIKAELTATTRCSFQRYTYPQEKDGRVMIDLMIPAEYRYAILDASVRQVDDHTIEGTAFSKPDRYGLKMTTRTIPSISPLNSTGRSAVLADG